MQCQYKSCVQICNINHMTGEQKLIGGLILLNDARVAIATGHIAMRTRYSVTVESSGVTMETRMRRCTTGGAIFYGL